LKDSNEVRRRYEVKYDPDRRRYVVEMLGETADRREVESYAEWGVADHMRTELNQRLDARGELLPERRR
ncbi:MAG: hypothetical protein ACRDHX_00700, partial [Chloroflexota bacterium]